MHQPSAIRIAIAGLLALAVAMGIGRFALTPILPMMQEDAGLSVAAGGWLASANYFGYLVGAISAMSTAALRVPAAVAIRLGLLSIGLATLAMGMVQNFSVQLVLRMLAGIGNAWVAIFAFAWCMSNLSRVRQPRLNGLAFAGVGAGIAAVGGICLALMHAAASSAQAWIVLGVLALLISAALWPAFSGDAGIARVAAPRAARRMQWRGTHLRLVFCFGAAGFGYIIPATFLPVMARQVIQDAAVFGWSWPLFGVAAMLSTLIAGALPCSADNRRIWLVSQLIMAFGVVLPVIWTGMAAIMIAALCVGGTFMVITMASMQEARAIGGSHVTEFIAALTAAFAFGQIAGPISVSAVVGAGDSFSAALLVASALLALSAFALWREAPGTTPIEICREEMR